MGPKTELLHLSINLNIPFPLPGRYSPVRRASEGSKVMTQFQGPLQECQQLQKGLAHRNLLVTPSPPLGDNSTSLPGSLAPSPQ